MNNQLGLFEGQNNKKETTPLAYQMRPKKLEDFAGQQKLKSRLKTIDFKNLPHIIFWGPPGSGKTTLATILAHQSGLEIYFFNAVLGGVNDLRKIIQGALELKQKEGHRSIIFIDEIHRFNKAQQDALLPYLEQGSFVLFGATTEYPQTSLNKAVLSRVQLWALERLEQNDIAAILQNAASKSGLVISSEIIDYLAKYSYGDARSGLNQLELLIPLKDQLQDYSLERLKNEIFHVKRSYDKDSERHYDVISAFIKSIRGSDPNAAILWLAVMLDGGEDPDFIARRLIISASEDIGNADPRALQMATSAHYGIKQIGMPEARILLAQATTYLACAPKSNASYLAINEAMSFVADNPTIDVPTHLRNHHPDKKAYKYPHDFPDHWVMQTYLPSDMEIQNFYSSSSIGYERMQSEYLDKIKR
jgi:putative ATPase